MLSVLLIFSFLILHHHKIEDGGSVNLSRPGIERVYGLERVKYVLRNIWTAPYNLFKTLHTQPVLNRARKM